MLVENRTNSTIYYDSLSGLSHHEWHSLLNNESIRKASLENHIKNCSYFSPHPHIYTPVLNGIYPIPPKTSWDFSFGKPILVHPSAEIQFPTSSTSLDNLTKIAERLLNRLQLRNIAVELSGGLDTSLIIAILKEVNIAPVLIGLESQRYEFRTERAIQNYYLNQVKQGVLIDYEKALPFARLLSTPPHPIPNKASLFYYGHQVIAETASRLGANTILNGVGIEPFLVEPLTSKTNQYLWRLAMEDSWPEEFIFSGFRCSYVNVAKIKPIYQLLLKLRKGQPLDIQKLWARKYFSKLLPRELTEYSYKAAFDGIFQAGLNAEIGNIRAMASAAYEFTGNIKLHPSTLEKKLEKASDLRQDENIEVLGKLSFVSWIHSLMLAKIIG